MNILILQIVRVAKILEAIFIIILTFALWLLLGSYVSKMTGYYEGGSLAWLFYFLFIGISFYHICYNNIVYNLRLTAKYRRYDCGLFLFDIPNRIMCSRLCAKNLCRDYQCSAFFCIKWIPLGIGILITVIMLLNDKNELENEKYNDDEGMALARLSGNCAYLLLAYLFQYLIFYALRVVLYCFFCCFAYCCGANT